MKLALKRSRIFASVLALLLLASLMNACSRGEQKSESATNTVAPGKVVKEFPLLGHLPQDTIGFFTTRSYGKAFEEYARSPWVQLGLTQGGGASPLSAASQLGQGQMGGQFLETFSKMTAQRDSIKALLLYIREKSAEQEGSAFPIFGLIADCKSENVCAAAVSAFEKESGIPVSRDDSGVLTLKIPHQSDGQPEQSLVVYLKQEGARIVASNDKTAIAQHLLTKQESEYVIPEKLLQSVAIDTALDIAWFDFQKFEKLSIAQQELPPEESHLPLYALLTRSFSGNSTQLMRAELKPETLQLPIFKTHSKGEQSPRLFSVSEGLIFEAGLSSAVIKEVIANIPADSGLPASAGTIQIALLDGGAVSPFPAIALAIETNEPAAVKSSLEQILTQSISKGGLPVDTNWMQTEVNGAAVSFIMSPLGIGIFLTETESAVLAATSQTALQTLIAGRSSVQAVKDEQGSLVMGSVDFNELTQAMESVQSSLAMFTGGESLLTPEQMTNLKALGTGKAKVALNGSELEFKAQY
jgi:hypothetical protein